MPLAFSGPVEARIIALGLIYIGAIQICEPCFYVPSGHEDGNTFSFLPWFNILSSTRSRKLIESTGHSSIVSVNKNDEGLINLVGFRSVRAKFHGIPFPHELLSRSRLPPFHSHAPR